ncbi:Ankyrin repeat domain-containing protein 7 [Spatholobus suberectus]|nr:Ankyrin repeat domain-containing protein 7 [Spatholobus suberectus]
MWTTKGAKYYVPTKKKKKGAKKDVPRRKSALRATNEGGDTPLHLAASRGFIGMCKCMIGEHGERKDLITAMNNKGETPLFRAVLTCHKKTFVYLHHCSKDLDVPLRNNDGDTILHRAIWGESLDMAIIITHCYRGLLDTRNKDGATPLKVLASKPSAFTSGNRLPWWMQILYYCIPVQPLAAEKAIKSYMEQVDKAGDYEHKVTIQVENEANKAHTFVLPNYATFIWFVKKAAGQLVSLSGLDTTAKELKELKKIKQKHKWSRQLLDGFMETPYESYVGAIGEEDVQPFITLQQLKI